MYEVKHIGGLLLIMWGLMVAMGGDLAFRLSSGEYRAIEIFTEQRWLGWTLVIIGADGFLPDKFSPWNILTNSLAKVIRFVISRIRTEKLPAETGGADDNSM